MMVGTRVARTPATLAHQLQQLRQDVAAIAQLVACHPRSDRAAIELAVTAAAREIAYLEVHARKVER